MEIQLSPLLLWMLLILKIKLRSKLTMCFLISIPEWGQHIHWGWPCWTGRADPYRAPTWPRGGGTCFLGRLAPKRNWEALSWLCIIYTVQIYRSNHPSLPTESKWRKREKPEVFQKNSPHECQELVKYIPCLMDSLARSLFYLKFRIQWHE